MRSVAEEACVYLRLPQLVLRWLFEWHGRLGRKTLENFGEELLQDGFRRLSGCLPQLVQDLCLELGELGNFFHNLQLCSFAVKVWRPLIQMRD